MSSDRSARGDGERLAEVTDQPSASAVIRPVLNELSMTRPLFHSEADFQHSLAWLLQQRHPQARIRLERRLPTQPITALDLMLTLDGRRIAIELKHFVRLLQHVHEEEPFALADQSASDTRRYDALKDIQRVERLIDEGLVETGCVIVLTNNATYWLDRSRGPGSGDAAFRLFEGREVSGILGWGPTAGPETRRKREEPLSIRDRYRLRWHNYSTVAEGPAGQFRVLVVDVPPLPKEEAAVDLGPAQ